MGRGFKPPTFLANLRALMASYETKTFKGTMKYLKFSPQAKKSNFSEINCSHYQATVLGSITDTRKL